MTDNVADHAVEHIANGADKLFIATTDATKQTVEIVSHAAGSIQDAIAKIAPDVWDILVRQQRVDGLVEIGICVFGWCSALTLFKVARILAKKDEEGNFVRKDGDPTVGFWFLVMAIVLLSANTIRSGVELPVALKKAINPKFYAMATLVSALGPQEKAK